jgi:hypothetical protein
MLVQLEVLFIKNHSHRALLPKFALVPLLQIDIIDLK